MTDEQIEKYTPFIAPLKELAANVKLCILPKAEFKITFIHRGKTLSSPVRLLDEIEHHVAWIAICIKRLDAISNKLENFPEMPEFTDSTIPSDFSWDSAVLLLKDWFPEQMLPARNVSVKIRQNIKYVVFQRQFYGFNIWHAEKVSGDFVATVKKAQERFVAYQREIVQLLLDKVELLTSFLAVSEDWMKPFLLLLSTKEADYFSYFFLPKYKDILKKEQKDVTKVTVEEKKATVVEEATKEEKKAHVDEKKATVEVETTKDEKKDVESKEKNAPTAEEKSVEKVPEKQNGYIATPFGCFERECAKSSGGAEYAAKQWSSLSDKEYKFYSHLAQAHNDFVKGKQPSAEELSAFETLRTNLMLAYGHI